MLVTLTDPSHMLAMLMTETITADRRRQARAARVESGDLYDDPPLAAPRRHAWSRLATIERGPNGKRTVRIFRAPAPAI